MCERKRSPEGSDEHLSECNTGDKGEGRKPVENRHVPYLGLLGGAPQ